MQTIKSLLALTGKKVKITTKPIGTGLDFNVYKGVIVSLYQDGQCAFIELDSGELINTRYIAAITIID